jgi:hypothetical protein
LFGWSTPDAIAHPQGVAVRQNSTSPRRPHDQRHVAAAIEIAQWMPGHFGIDTMMRR